MFVAPVAEPLTAAEEVVDAIPKVAGAPSLLS
jgi:hypothetical protein